MNTPWYRQFWPWFLFGLPGLVVAAGLTTWWIAERNADSLVADDYYKQGLAINRELDKEKRARALNIGASVWFDNGAIEIELAGESDPAAVVLYLSHPLNASRDLELRAPRIAPGRYRVPAALGNDSRWLWQLEPVGGNAGAWRVDGELSITGADAG